MDRSTKPYPIIMKTIIKVFPLVLAFGIVSNLAAQANSPWLLPEKKLTFSTTYVYQNYQDFWIGSEKAKLPDDITQNSVFFGLEYGLTDAVTLDFSTGYSRASFSPPGESVPDIDGLYDTNVGLRFRLLDEYERPGAPTVALRVGGIIQGSYEASNVHSPGDGASGAEVSFLIGKSWLDQQFGLTGELGFRDRNENVPADFFCSVGFYKMFLGRGSFSGAYRRNQGLSGLDIGGPGFSPDKFPQLKEINDNLEVGVGLTDEGGRYYGFFVGRTVNGRNTGEKTALGATVSFPF